MLHQHHSTDNESNAFKTSNLVLLINISATSNVTR